MTTTPITKRQFNQLALQRLQYRWLGDRSIVKQAVKDLFGRRHALCNQFVDQVVAAHSAGKLDRLSLPGWLRSSACVAKLFKKNDRIRVPEILTKTERGYRWPVPRIDNQNQLSDFLTLTAPRLIDWLTLPHRRRATSVDHYRRFSMRKRDGSIRWIEQPAPTLKRIQRIIHRELLSQVPIHDAAYGFRRGRNIETCARQHCGRSTVLRIDLEDFFGGISSRRVRALMQIAGYSKPIAQQLAWICTAPALNVPKDPAMQSLQRTRLAQGAPTSPSLANAIAFRMDRRLAGLCQSMEVTYTRYADDLIFSSDNLSLPHAKRFLTTVAIIAIEEGFRVNFRKTKFMRHGTRQKVLGLTVNEKPNIVREDYMRLKATIHNCVQHGPESQNRDGQPDFRSSLRGRIAHVMRLSPVRGQKLLTAFQSIKW